MKEDRPWGWYEVIEQGDRYKVKSVEIQPGQKLSLHLHHHRAEHWIVVGGTLKVEVDGKETLVFDNQSTYCLLYTSPSPRDLSTSRMPSSA